MLQLSGLLVNRPVLSLRTGTQVAVTQAPIINPNNLKVEGFHCQNIDRKQVILLSQDIRDIMIQGLLINDEDVLSDADDLMRLKQVLSFNFELLGKRVETSGGHKLGKVGDYATDVESMFIKKIYVVQSILKNFSGGNLGIDRTQIVEITDKKIVVNDLNAKVPARAGAIA
jgi:uncharacterized protein YrrD